MLFISHSKKRVPKRGMEVIIELNKRKLSIKVNDLKKKTKLNNLIHNFKKTDGKGDWEAVRTYAEIVENMKENKTAPVDRFRMKLVHHTYCFYEKFVKYAKQKKAPADFIESLKQEMKRIAKQAQR